jgi:aryl-alcohol dehydrogenase-like predicted oxidoreductase
MEHRVLGRTGLNVSAIGFGAWGIGGALWSGSDDARSVKALQAALEAGCDFIDTALAYGDGHSEQLVARVLSTARTPVTVATKVPPRDRVWPARRGVPLAAVFPAGYVRECAERSAANLGRPVDLLQLHVWRDEWLREREWAAVESVLQALLAAGTVRHVGISINDHDPASALEAVRRCELIECVQVIYNVFDRSPERALFPLCRERNVGVIARVPFDEGSLAGAVRADTVFPPEDFRHDYFGGDRRAQVVRRVAALEPLLRTEAADLAEGALRFCLSHDAVTTVIPGMRTPEHARANCRAGDGRRLSPALLGRLETHAWPRNFYAGAETTGGRYATLTLLLAVLLLAVWGLGTFAVPVGAGWVHLFLAAGAILLVRWVVVRPGGA